jgi:hypothetical protein
MSLQEIQAATRSVRTVGTKPLAPAEARRRGRYTEETDARSPRKRIRDLYPK